MTQPTPQRWSEIPVDRAAYRFEGIPWQDRTTAALWNRACAAGGSADFITFDGSEPVTYSTLDHAVRCWSATLARFDLAPGDRVAVMLSNRMDHLALFLAVTTSSVAIVPVNTELKGELLRHVLTDSGASVLVTTADMIGNVEPSWDLPDLRHVVLLEDGKVLPESVPHVEIHAAAQLIAHADPASGAGRAPSPTDVAAVLYTSGTTGPAKGVVVTHEYFIFYAWAFAHAMDHSPHDVLFTPLPMFHANALAVTIFPALIVGAQVAVYSRFSASRFWDQIADSGATHFAGMGAIGNILLSRSKNEFRADHQLRVCHLVPAPDNVAEFEERFGVPVTYAIYGMTEGMVILPSRDGTHRPSLMGQHHPYHDIAIVDEHDRPVATGAAGEMVIRPLLPNIMFREYLGRPDATVEAFRDLWFHTGDLAMRDEAGDLWFLGRVKEAIRRRGENISAFEVEREALSCPGVGEVAVVGVPSELGEEEVFLAVAPVDGVVLEPSAVHRHCADRMPAYMVPRYIEVRAELPKNASQKVLKSQLRDEGIRPGVWDSTRA